MPVQCSFGDLWAEIGRVFGENRALTLLLLAVIGAGYTGLDLLSEHFSSVSGLIVSVFVQYAFLEKVLDVPAGEKRRFGSMLGMMLMSGIGIIVGLVLLIVPGLFLAARWIAAPAYVVAGGKRSSESLSASWEATRGCWLTVMLAYLVYLVPVAFALALLALLGMPFLSGMGPADPALWQSVFLNLWAAGIVVFNWLIVAAVYRLVEEQGHTVESVFA
ncbi:MAG: hypothetical protein P8Y58_17880 [Novosphingobium sp.]